MIFISFTRKNNFFIYSYFWRTVYRKTIYFLENKFLIKELQLVHKNVRMYVNCIDIMSRAICLNITNSFVTFLVVQHWRCIKVCVASLHHQNFRSCLIKLSLIVESAEHPLFLISSLRVAFSCKYVLIDYNK